jgi:hypothetical protein
MARAAQTQESMPPLRSTTDLSLLPGKTASNCFYYLIGEIVSSENRVLGWSGDLVIGTACAPFFAATIEIEFPTNSCTALTDSPNPITRSPDHGGHPMFTRLWWLAPR